MRTARPEVVPDGVYGPYSVAHTVDELVLTRENHREFALKSCAFFLLAAFCISVLAVLSVVIGSRPDGADALFPRRNVMGAFWGFGIVGMCVGGPLYLMRTYRSVLTFRFRRSDQGFYRGRELITRFRRIECVQIWENFDPAGQYLYLLHLVYADGRYLMVHNGYDEREVMNLAKEIASFIDVEVRWRG